MKILNFEKKKIKDFRLISTNNQTNVTKLRLWKYDHTQIFAYKSVTKTFETDEFLYICYLCLKVDVCYDTLRFIINERIRSSSHQREFAIFINNTSAQNKDLQNRHKTIWKLKLLLSKPFSRLKWNFLTYWISVCLVHSIYTL